MGLDGGWVVVKRAGGAMVFHTTATAGMIQIDIILITCMHHVSFAIIDCLFRFRSNQVFKAGEDYAHRVMDKLMIKR
jgi:hypothetical protein